MDKVYEFLKNNSGIKMSDTICLGVSGGPDSMALLNLMLKLKNELDLRIVVAHVNHNVRKESDEEEEYVRNYCIENRLFFESMKIEEFGDDNFENEARTIRYNFFDKVCLEYRAKFLLTAHHGDDLIETVLMRIVRGSTLKGYSGFSKVVEKENYTILRPLISVTKQDLINYCTTNNVKYYVDKTNFEDIHTRNRYRKYVLPFLKEESPLVHEKFLKFSETLLEYNEYVQKEMNQVINKVFNNGALNISKFNELDHLIQTKIIYNILEKIYGDDLFIITNTHVNLIFNLINSEKSQSMIHLPNNIKVLKSYNELEFSYDEEESDAYEIELNDLVSLPSGNIIEVLKEDEINNNSNFITRLSSNEVTLPLYVRTRREGDKIEVKGLMGHKKVNDIFIDSKIPTKDRYMWPIVCDAKDNIVWLPGLKKSKFDIPKNESYDIILKYSLKGEINEKEK